MLSGASVAMNTRLSGRDNITLGLLSIGMKPEEVAATELEVVEYTELGDFIDMPVTTYSSGMKSRLLFAIKTHQTPDILLLDEALSVGDKTFKQKSLERVNGIRESAGAVVMATHQPAEIRESCNYAMWLKDGQGDVIRRSRRSDRRIRISRWLPDATPGRTSNQTTRHPPNAAGTNADHRLNCSLPHDSAIGTQLHLWH